MLIKIKIRRGPGWDVKPDAELLDGKIFEVDEDDVAMTRQETSLYVGERRLWFRPPLTTDITWIASGDAEVIN